MEVSITPKIFSGPSDNFRIYKEGLAYRLKKFDGRLGKQGFVQIFCSYNWPPSILSLSTPLQSSPSNQVESIVDFESNGLGLRFEFFESVSKVGSGTSKFSCNLNKLFFVQHASIGKHQHSLALYLESAAAVYLAWETEDECLEWSSAARHLLAVLQAARPIPLFAALKFVVQCTILQCKLGRHLNSHGLARICLTELGEILIVQESFAHPITCLPLQCLRHLKYSQSGLFVFNLGRASPYGEGELHVQMADKQEAKRLHDAILDHRPFEDQRSSKRSLTHHRSARRTFSRNLKTNASASVKLRQHLSEDVSEDVNVAAPVNNSLSRESSVLSNLITEKNDCVANGYVEMSVHSSSSGNLRVAQFDNVIVDEVGPIESKGKGSPHLIAQQSCRKNCASVVMLPKSSSRNSTDSHSLHHLHTYQEDAKHTCCTPEFAAEELLSRCTRFSISSSTSTNTNQQDDVISSRAVSSSESSSKVSSTANSSRMLDCINMQCTEYSENAVLTKRTYSVGSRPQIRSGANSDANSEEAGKCSSTPYLPSRVKIVSTRDGVAAATAAAAVTAAVSLRSSTPHSSNNNSSSTDVDIFMEMSFQRPRTTSDASRYNRARNDFARPLAASYTKRSSCGVRAQAAAHEQHTASRKLHTAGSASSITTATTTQGGGMDSCVTTTAAKDVSDYMFMGNVKPSRNSHSSSHESGETSSSSINNFAMDDVVYVEQGRLGTSTSSLSIEKLSRSFVDKDTTMNSSSSLNCAADPYLFFNPRCGSVTPPKQTYLLETTTTTATLSNQSCTLSSSKPNQIASDAMNYVQLDLCATAHTVDNSCNGFDNSLDQKSILSQTANHQSGMRAASHSVLPVTSYSSINFVKHSM